jgi:hypothetical protein
LPAHNGGAGQRLAALEGDRAAYREQARWSMTSVRGAANRGELATDDASAASGSRRHGPPATSSTS